MRLHRLELEGFGPFRERQVVDFDAFERDGIFLIAGRTGAGKSSVLDGVCFALYGSAPRYDGAEKRLRSDHCAPDDPTSVTVEFTVADRRWRVTRSPEYLRPKKRGGGFTKLAPDARLDERVDGEWIGRAWGPRNVALELDEIVGLSQQQFLQVILLAQNRFAEFLLAKNDERQRLLRTLFATKTYEQYQDALEQRRKDGERALAGAVDGAALLLDEAERVAEDAWAHAEDGGEAELDVAARLARAERAQARLDYRVETLVAERDAADAAHRRAEVAHAERRELRARHQARARSRTALVELEAASAEVDVARRMRDRANAAEVLRASLDAAVDAAGRAAAADTEYERALAVWTDSGREEREIADLRAVIEGATGELAVAEAALDEEREVDALRSALAALRVREDDIRTRLAGIDERRAELPVRLAQLDADLAAAVESAGARDGHEKQIALLTQRRDAAARLPGLAEALRRADAARAMRLDDVESASAHLRQLIRRRHAGFASELAAQLVDGEPCAVCGALEHPAPAVAADEAVTDDAVTSAEARHDAAIAAEREAASATTEARAALAEAQTAAGAASLDDLEAEHSEVAALLAASDAAVRRRGELEAERRRLGEADAQAAAEREVLAAERGEQQQKIAAAEEKIAAMARRVDAARGEYAAIDERITAVRAVRDRAEQLVRASEERTRRHETLATARAGLDARIAGSDFDDAEDATAALLPAADRASLDAAITEHEVALRSERDRLRDLELELAGVDDAPIDVDETAAAVAEARERWSTAVDAAAAADQRRARLADLRTRAEAALAETAELAEEQAALSRLANTVAGRAPNTHRMSLESFVLAAELEEIVDAANLRLSEMSSGRYALQHSDALAARGAASGLGLTVLDAHTGQARPAQSLSGGETFLASLALALGLAEVVTARAGGVRLDTLFIDEGFGSLDAETLDLAMRTLDELRQGGRTVGLISHVAAMKEQIPAQLLVEATPQGPSTIRAGVNAAA